MDIRVLIGFAMYLAGMSIIAFVLYKLDKVKAQKKKWRIRESALLLVGFAGGAAGALSGMKIFRHKTKHWYFWAVNIAGAVWQAAVLIILIFKFI